ncbi:MAG: type IV pilin [Haloarculaceae archaeon]
MARRGVAPVVAVALLVLVTVVGASAVFTVVDGLSTADTSERLSIALAVDADTGRIAVTHRGGSRVDVRSISLAVAVDGEPLRFQPPVPFFAARGFASGPSGPFNTASDPNWTVGERATVRLAGTNDPQIRHGSRVELTVRRDGRRLVTVRATAR